MSADDGKASVPIETRALLLLLVTVSIALGWILLPFYGTIMWGVIIALLFAPLNRRLQQRLKGRRTPAALLTLAIVLVIVVIAALAGGTLLGVLGALVAIPVAASILIIIDEVVVPKQNEA